MVELHRVDDPLSACAQAVARALIEADRAHGHARLAIPGGSALACVGPVRRALGSQVWSRLALTWADERCVPFASEESCRGVAYRAGHLARTDAPAVELALYLDADGTPDAAVARSTAAFADDFDGALDVALLGLGPDGHVASLFPGHRALSARAAIVHVPDAPKPPPSRLTLSVPILSKARVFVFVRGADKRDAVDAVMRGAGVSPLDRWADVQIFTDGSTR